MARFVITLVLSQTPVTYLYEDVQRALAKARALQRAASEFTITYADGATLRIEDLEKEVAKR